jgi:hypothetical protein
MRCPELTACANRIEYIRHQLGGIYRSKAGWEPLPQDGAFSRDGAPAVLHHRLVATRWRRK